MESCTVEKFVFKSEPPKDFIEYDTPWEADFESTGYKKIYELLKSINKLFYNNELKCNSFNFNNCIINGINPDNINYFEEFNLLFDFKEISNNNEIFVENNLLKCKENTIITPLKCTSSLENIIEYEINKYSDENEIVADYEDFILLKNLMPFGMKTKYQFKDINEFVYEMEICYKTDFDPNVLLFDLNLINFNEDEIKALSLQAPKLIENLFGKKFVKKKVWDYFKMSFDNANNQISNLIKNTLKNKDFLKCLLSNNEDYKIEICRIINTAENTQINCTRNTNYLFKELGLDYFY